MMDFAETGRTHHVTRAEGIMAKLRRLIALWGEGKTDAEISEALGGVGWSRKTVKRYRQALRLVNVGEGPGKWKRRAPGGRWSAL